MEGLALRPKEVKARSEFPLWAARINVTGSCKVQSKWAFLVAAEYMVMEQVFQLIWEETQGTREGKVEMNF